MNWKNQTKFIVQNLNAADDFIPDKETVITDGINYFISTEIIEKIIYDIEHMEEPKAWRKWSVERQLGYNLALDDAVQQLTEKWLNN